MPFDRLSKLGEKPLKIRQEERPKSRGFRTLVDRRKGHSELFCRGLCIDIFINIGEGAERLAGRVNESKLLSIIAHKYPPASD